MAIQSQSKITWSDLATKCYNAIISCCCNIDNINSVPTRLRSGSARLEVKNVTWNVGGYQDTRSASYYADGTNLVSAVASNTVLNEWNTFLGAAGIDVRSNKICQAKEVGLVIGLYQQFLAYHLKPIYSVREAYKEKEAQTLFQGTKYITGTCSPKYTLTAIEPGNIPEVIDSDITNIINQSIYWPGNNWGMLNYTGDPAISRSYLS